MKKILVGVVFLLTIFVFAGCTNDNTGQEAAKDDSSIIFFYGKECPHCKKVEAYFTENKVAEKIQFSQREVYHDAPNRLLMAEKAKQCGLDEDNMGVPMLWAEGKCLVGDEDIVKFFNDKLKSNAKN